MTLNLPQTPIDELRSRLTDGERAAVAAQARRRGSGADRTLGWVREGMAYIPAERDADWPIPEDLHGADVVELADGRSRISHAGGSAYAVRRSIDQAIAAELGPYGALRLGDTFLQVGRDATRRIPDKGKWWRFVATEIRQMPVADGARLLEALFNADLVKVRGLRPLAEWSGHSEQGIRDEFLEYVPGRRPYKINTPRRADWPGWAERLRDGEAVRTAARLPGPVDPKELREAARDIEDGREGTT